MQLKNHNKENHYTINNDSSVMRGTIEMNRKEYARAIIFIQNEYAKATKKINTAIRDGLATALIHHREDYMAPIGSNFVCLGVTATALIAKRYKLSNYKNVNYAIKITNK